MNCNWPEDLSLLRWCVRSVVCAGGRAPYVASMCFEIADLFEPFASFRALIVDIIICKKRKIQSIIQTWRALICCTVQHIGTRYNILILLGNRIYLWIRRQSGRRRRRRRRLILEIINQHLITRHCYIQTNLSSPLKILVKDEQFCFQHLDWNRRTWKLNEQKDQGGHGL